jgi:hypothetical protein
MSIRARDTAYDRSAAFQQCADGFTATWADTQCDCASPTNDPYQPKNRSAAVLGDHSRYCERCVGRARVRRDSHRRAALGLRATEASPGQRRRLSTRLPRKRSGAQNRPGPATIRSATRRCARWETRWQAGDTLKRAGARCSRQPVTGPLSVSPSRDLLTSSGKALA